MKRNVLVTGAWPYANYLLHIGHLVALLPGDVIARYYRMNGDNVVYVSGSDCHGTPITERAKKEGKTPSEIAMYYHNEDKKSLEAAGFSYDMYTSTESDYHKEKVMKYFKMMYDNGNIYEKEEMQDYCTTCNKFLSDREIIGTCPHCGGEAKGDQCDSCLASLESNELLNRRCSTCGNTPITKANKHLYLELSKFQKDIENLIKERESIWRKNALNESKKFLSMGLIDRAATRQLDWGIEVPVDGYEDKRIYVWIEAVLGYITTCERVLEERGEDFNKFITDPNLISYYSIGKDNIPFHTIIFPAILKAIGANMSLPTHIISCEFMNMSNEKMSKSKGNLITINDIIEKYGKDTVRYFMIANGPEKKDSNFSEQDLIMAHNKFLVGALGNFINRNVSFINKKFDGVVKEGKVDEGIINLTKETYKEVAALIEAGELRSAIDKAFDYVDAANKYYDEQTPWIKVKEDMDAFNDVTYTCMYMIANLSNLLAPFIPDTCDRIKSLLSIKENGWNEVNLSGDIKLNDIGLLFQRIDVD